MNATIDFATADDLESMADLLAELSQRGTLPESYAILELSGELRERQRHTLAATVPDLLPRVTWLDRLPDHFDGLVLANELLDAMLAHPILINRPVVVTPLGTKLCRPSEVVLDILPDPQQGAFTKEDGEAVIDEHGNRVSH